MRSKRTTRRLAIISVIVVGTLGLAHVALAQTTEIPGLEVTAALPGTVHQAETFAVTFELTNTGNTPLQSVVVTTQDACAPSSTNGLVEFTEIQGNGDDVFDPTEVWSYLAPRCVDSGAPSVGIAVSASDGVDPLSGTYVFGYSPVIPLEVDTIGDVTADECLHRGFEFPFRMVTGTTSNVPLAFLAYAITLDGGGLQVVDRVEFTEIQNVSADNNALFDPGEEYLARFFFGNLNQCPDLPEPPLVLLLSMESTSVDSGARWCFGTEGCPTPAMQVGTIVELVTEQEDPPATTTPPVTTDPTLPFTGSETDGLAMLGVALLAAGALLVAVSGEVKRDRRN